MAFGRAYCLAADDQLTPPSSPDARRYKFQQPPRLQLSRLLKRPKLSRKCTTDNVVRPVELESIKQPFPKLLDSPVETESSSTATGSPVDQPELRRVSASYHDLRSLGSHHPLQTPTHVPTPLLPSPITHHFPQKEATYFQFHNPRLPREEGEYRSYDDLHILSYYYDDSRTESLNDIERELDESPSEGGCSLQDDDSNSSASYDLPVTPTNKAPRRIRCSDESDWLANSMTPDERLRRFKARCYQVIQHPISGIANGKDNDSVVSDYATTSYFLLIFEAVCDCQVWCPRNEAEVDSDRSSRFQ
jgi:hypothetical protein